MHICIVVGHSANKVFSNLIYSLDSANPFNHPHMPPLHSLDNILCTLRVLRSVTFRVLVVFAYTCMHIAQDHICLQYLLSNSQDHILDSLVFAIYIHFLHLFGLCCSPVTSQVRLDFPFHFNSHNLGWFGLHYSLVMSLIRLDFAIHQSHLRFVWTLLLVSHVFYSFGLLYSIYQ